MSLVAENENGEVSVTLVKDDYVLVNTFENSNVVFKITNKDGEVVVEGIVENKE